MGKKSTLPPCLTASVETHQRNSRLASRINKAFFLSLSLQGEPFIPESTAPSHSPSPSPSDPPPSPLTARGAPSTLIKPQPPPPRHGRRLLEMTSAAVWRYWGGGGVGTVATACWLLANVNRAPGQGGGRGRRGCCGAQSRTSLPSTHVYASTRQTWKFQRTQNYKCITCKELSGDERASWYCLV